MKKSELVKKVNDKVEGLTLEKVNLTINALFEVLGEALMDGDSYSHDKFGTFKVVERAPRKGRNPQTKEEIDIPAKKAIKLIVSSSLKKDLNK